MREIKFRAWDNIAKAMYFSGNSIRAIWETLPKLYDEGNFIIMQYTGLKDKNGKEIYEGDILEVMEEEIVVVEWDNTIAGFNADVKYADRGWREQVVDHVDTMEVIGNIYENPELLKEDVHAK